MNGLELISWILGEGLFFFMLAVLPYLWWRGQRKLSWQVFLIVGLSVLVVLLLKGLFPTRRPFEIFGAKLLPLTSYGFNDSFPSLHVAVAFALATTVWDRRHRLGGLLFLAAILVAMGRVLLWVHFPWDVVAGAVVGAGVAFLSSRYLFRIRD